MPNPLFLMKKGEYMKMGLYEPLAIKDGLTRFSENLPGN
jgi:hypothetical protein